VALSGGLDSTVLLGALASLRDAGALPPLRAVHVDHGLHPDAARWSRHCRAAAASLDIPCEIVEVAAVAARGESPEAAARAARYGALAKRLGPGEVLLTAHHADDQLEGILLQWLRGGGLRAIEGMRPVTPFAAGWHARPMLGFTRAQIAQWASERGLAWLADPSNEDARFDRNYLRHEVLPAVRRRWPAAAQTVARVARQAAEVMAMDAATAAVDLAAAAEGATLPLARLRAMPQPRQRRLLREWLRVQGLPLPAAATLEALRCDMLAAAPDRLPETRWPGGVVRRYRDRLYAETAAAGETAWSAADWRPGDAFGLGSLGRLELQPAFGSGLAISRLRGPLRVEPRPAGALFEPAGSAHRRELRKWLQEHGVLPWRRARLPVLCVGDEIVAVADLACSARFAAGPGEASWRVVWHGRPTLTEGEAVRGCRAMPHFD
jgi:tRNA(Ile)-lysidine synthase